MEAIDKAGKEKGDQVIKELLRLVVEVKPEVPDRVSES